MNTPCTEAGVVLRDTLLDAEAVRIGARAAKQPPAPAPAVAPPVLSPPPAAEREALPEAALAKAREEGLRLGRDEGLRIGHEEGLKQGHAEAQVAARAELEKAVTEATASLRERERQLAELVARFGEQEAAWRAAAEDEAVALAFELACRVLGTALVTPEGVRAQAQQLLAISRHRAPVFHVHPKDLPLLQHDATQECAPRWEADAAVDTGGCLVKGPSGALDARLETILDQCRQGLLELRAHRGDALGAAA